MICQLKKFKKALENGFIFNQRNKLTKKNL